MGAAIRVGLVVAAVGAATIAAACSGGTGDPTRGTGGSGGGPGGGLGATTGTPAPARPVAWPAFGFDPANSRFNKYERTVTPANAATLAPVWEVTGLTGVASTPSIVDGVAYFGAWDDAVHAVDVATGKERWATKLPRRGVPGVMSSVTIDEGAAYAAVAGTLVKLDRATGSIAWTAVVSEHPIAIQPASPVVAGDLVIQAAASGELMVPVADYSFRGVVRAFDASTGKMVWERFTTPDDPAAGGAGVGVWSTASLDPARRLLFVGTGNTYEPPAAPLSDSIVALRYETGEVAWSRQFTYPDVWSTGNKGGVDGDVGAGPNLWERGGRAFVGAGDKRGVYHALDRETGAVVWETKLTDGSLLGGVIGTSAVGEGRIYVGSNIGDPVSNGPTGNAKVIALDLGDGHLLWEVTLAGAIYAPVTATPGLVYAATTGGTMVVLDAASGRQLWSHTAPDQVGSGPSVVDGTVYWGYGFSLFGTGGGNGGVIAFRPGGAGTVGSSAPAGDAAAGGGQPAPDAPGADLFRKSCAQCHGLRGTGLVGPDLTHIAEKYTFDQHVQVVTGGKGTQMPAFGSTLSADEIRRVVEYERTHL